MSDARKTDIKGKVGGSIAAAGLRVGGGACYPESCQVPSVPTVGVHWGEASLAEEYGGWGRVEVVHDPLAHPVPEEVEGF